MVPEITRKSYLNTEKATTMENRELLLSAGTETWNSVCQELEIRGTKSKMPKFSFVHDFDNLDKHFYNEVGAYILPEEEAYMHVPSSNGRGYLLINEHSDPLSEKGRLGLMKQAYKSTLLHESIHLLRYRYRNQNGDVGVRNLFLAHREPKAAKTKEEYEVYKKILLAHLSADEGLARMSTAVIEGWELKAILGDISHFNGRKSKETDYVQKTYWNAALTGYYSAYYIMTNFEREKRLKVIGDLLKNTPYVEVGKILSNFSEQAERSLMK